MAQKVAGNNKKGCLVGCLATILAPILFVGGFIYVGLYGVMRSDEEILRTYRPSEEIADIVQKTTMTEKAKAAFFRGDPEFIQGEKFKKECLDSGELAAGCKVGKVSKGLFGLPTQTIKIYILRIEDPKFRDHKYLTAAHEMLHVAYSRLPGDEKKRINALIDAEITKRPDDKELAERVEAMNRMGKSYHDELHAKFGTDYADVSSELEEHYAEYLADRKRLLAIAASDGFNSRVRRLKQLSGQEARKVYGEIQEFFRYVDPDYQPPQK